MKFTTAYNHRDRLRSLLRDTFSSARYGAMTHADLLKMLADRIYSDSGYKRAPSWVASSLHDLSNELHSGMYHPVLRGSDLVKLAVGAIKPESIAYVRWAMRVDGIERDSDWVSARREAGDDDVWQRVMGAHVWNHRPDRLYSGGWELTGPYRGTLKNTVTAG